MGIQTASRGLAWFRVVEGRGTGPRRAAPGVSAPEVGRPHFLQRYEVSPPKSAATSHLEVPMDDQQGAASLYDRLGGVYNVAVVIDDLIDQVMDDPRLNANPRVDEAHHRVSRAGFKYYVTEMLCGAAGGPQVYTGRSMGDSHRHLLITED